MNKCPKCKSKITIDDIFCKNCGAPIKIDIDKNKIDDNRKKNEDITILNDESKEISLNNTKNNKGFIILTLIIFLFAFLTIYLGYELHSSKEVECICEEKTKVVEKIIEPSYQLINYDGNIYKLSLDYSFYSSDNVYNFLNNDKTIYIKLSKITDVSFDTFITSDYQKEYVQNLQMNKNIIIRSSGLKTENDISYYILEGEYDSYSYMIIATKNKEEIILTEVQFESKVALNSKKNELIDFALSYIKS